VISRCYAGVCRNALVRLAPRGARSCICRGADSLAAAREQVAVSAQGRERGRTSARLLLGPSMWLQAGSESASAGLSGRKGQVLSRQRDPARLGGSLAAGFVAERRSRRHRLARCSIAQDRHSEQLLPHCPGGTSSPQIGPSGSCWVRSEHVRGSAGSGASLLSNAVVAAAREPARADTGGDVGTSSPPAKIQELEALVHGARPRAAPTRDRSKVPVGGEERRGSCARQPLARIDAAAGRIPAPIGLSQPFGAGSPADPVHRALRQILGKR
jgi:hypothetical protein